MKRTWLKFPDNRAEFIEISKQFERKWYFPHCVGALDGKHIAFRAKKHDGSLYYNYQGFNSIVLLALCDADFKFIYIDIGCNGRISDGCVYNRSDLKKVIDAGTTLPSDDVVGNNRILPYIIIGDDGFALGKHLMKPFAYESKEKEKKIFNCRLSFARQNIEHAFGILCNRFRVLQSTIHLNPEKVTKIVQACCVLHSFLIMKNISYLDPILLTQQPHILNSENRLTNPKRNSNEAGNIRKQFAEYFAAEGQIPWQEAYI